MNALFYIAAIVAVLATLRTITASHAIHGLLYFIVSLFSVAFIFFLLGAPFAGALEIIVYAGAIMVLFVFVVMLLNLGPETAKQEREWMRGGIWIGPAVLAAVIGGELAWLSLHGSAIATGVEVVSPKSVAITLLGPYLLAVEVASMLLLAGLVAAYHIGRRNPNDEAGSS